MGSGYSSQQSTISIDPSGKVTYKNALDQPKPDEKKHQSSEEKQTSPQGANSPEQQLELPESNEAPAKPVKAPEPVEPLNTLEQTTSSIFNLNFQYHPSVFENIENRLIHCYASNKGRSTECSQMEKEYKSYVKQQREQLLTKSFKTTPLVTTTTMLVLVSCLLLHLIQPVACYGAMSVDLGSEWMKVGLVAPSVPMDIVLNAASQRKTSMAVGFSNGERFIGDSALDLASKYPDRVYTHFLDLVGKTVQDESVKHFQQRFPHANITSHEPNSTSIVLNHPQGLQLTPIELLAMMLQHAHDQVVTRLNSEELASDVVITVPPFFNALEKRVVRDAARLAGLNVLRLTNVNSAFALSYGIYRHKEYLHEAVEGSIVANRTTILFFDQGASQTSATLADYKLVDYHDSTSDKNETLPTVLIRAQVYDRFLGGFDMQLRLRDFLVDAFSKETKIDKSRIYARGRSIAKLTRESAKVKRVLSANTDHLVRIENVIDDKDMKFAMTRQQYEDLNKDYLEERTTQLLDRLFSMANVSRDDTIESVIIVGGNTRTPKIQQVLLDYFKLETLGKSINADEGAALAALYQAASLGRGFKVKRFVLDEPEGEQVSDPNEEQYVIYNQTELDRIHARLNDWREQDHMRLQRLSMMNSLESLLAEGRHVDDENLQVLIKETYVWLEDGPSDEKDNVTILAEKFQAIFTVLHPPASTTLPPPPPPTLSPASPPAEQSESPDSSVTPEPSPDPATTEPSGGNETESNIELIPTPSKSPEPPHSEL